MPPSASLLLLVMALTTALLAAVVARLLVRGERTFPTGSTPWLELTTFALVALLALWLFSEVTDNTIDRDELARLDGRIMTALTPWRTGTGLAVAQTISFCATLPAMTAAALIVAVTLHRRNWFAVLVGWTLVVGGGQLAGEQLKGSFHRTRPSGAHLFIDDASYSYPSGHSMGAMIGFGVLAYVLLMRVPRIAGRVTIVALAALMIVAVGLSRLVLGVHYFTDVVGGFAAGAVWLSLAMAAVESQRWRRGGNGATLTRSP